MRPHTFHIPVMGTGFTIDTPLRVGRFGISSVMSLVDDELVEQVRRHHARAAGVPFERIAASEPDARARRITAWLDLVDEILDRQIRDLRAQAFRPGSDKWKYFALLPSETAIRPGDAAGIVRGSADCNIMAKLDRARLDRHGNDLGADQSDAKAALRGFAKSRLSSDLVLSAGLNPSLLAYLETFSAFRSSKGDVPTKGIILKVSDFRSAIVQTKLLARRGLRPKEIRIESGLNCGGHVFPTDGRLLGPVLAEFRDRRDELARALAGPEAPLRVTVQGGLGTFGETRRVREGYGVDGTGWGTPFLLVPEATALDERTRWLIARAKEDDLYTSDVSPLGIPFNNLRGTSSEAWTRRRIREGRPGSPCPRGHLASNTELSSTPICTASGEYQRRVLRALGWDAPPRWEVADGAARAVYEKTCICHHLGNGALVSLGLGRSEIPVAVCPGPNAAWFDRTYSLEEMVDHIYGRGPSLVPTDRPHFFAKELEMYVEHYGRLLALGESRIDAFRKNLVEGLAHYRALVRRPAYPGENLDSLAGAIDAAERRLAEAEGVGESDRSIPARV